MKSIVLFLLLFISNDPKDIARVNALKKEAEKAFIEGNYDLAISNYSILTDSLLINDDLIELNLGHAYYHTGDTANAKLFYGRASTTNDKKLKSITYQQLGVLSKEAGKLEESLQQLKASIKADPTNQEAIYNYEVVKKLLEEQKEQQQQQDNQNQENQEEKEKQEGEDQNQEQQQGGDQEQKDQEGENKEQQQEQENQDNQDQQQQQEQEGEQKEQEQEKSQEQITKEKLEEMGISEEKARQLLEAMRQSEIKYLQNQRRKATKRPPSGKPDW